MSEETKADRMVSVIQEVIDERLRQDAKWGEQNHPSGAVDALHDVAGADRLGCFTADHAREKCQMAFTENRGTYGHILLEEVAEAFEEEDEARLRAELVQVAAVTVAWIEAIDRRRAEGKESDEDRKSVAAAWPHLQAIERTIVEMRSEFADDHPTIDRELAGVAREVQALAAWLRGGE